MPISRKYETVVIFKANLSEEETAAQVEKFKNLISENGTVENVDEWGKRRLAYPIQDENEGYYVQYNFTAPVNFPAEFERQLKIDDKVLRSLIIDQTKK
jgi:small subunit ribosomal protein S6